MRWLRWVLFIPLGVYLGRILERGIDSLVLVFDAVPAEGTAAGIAWIAFRKIVSAWSLTFFPAFISPRPRSVGRIAFAVGVLLGMLPVLHRLVTGFPLSGIAYSVGAMLVDVFGGVLGLLTVHALLRASAGAESEPDNLSSPGLERSAGAAEQ